MNCRVFYIAIAVTSALHLLARTPALGGPQCDPEIVSASDATPDDWFGSGVTVSGSYVAVGADRAENDAGVSTGAVSVYRNEGSKWVEQVKLIAAAAAAGDRFGRSVSMDKALLVVGAGLPGNYASIQAAIDASRDGDEIVVAPGIYHEAIDFIGKAITLRSSGGSDVTTIDASGLESSVVICATGEGPHTSLKGFTVTGGHATMGGGMHNSYSSPTVSNCVFSGNSADRYGGGMYSVGGSPIVTNCTFIGNSTVEAQETGGGGMYNAYGSPTVSDCIFSANSSNGYGGGGGGMSNVGGNPIVTNCTFTGNSATGYNGAGGGMYNEGGGNPTVTQCSFSGNAAEYGGGVYNRENNPTVTNCTFNGNSAEEYGGGMRNFSSIAIVTNCTFIGNLANFAGGGIANTYSDVAVANCTFIQNSAFDGGGVFHWEGTSTITNCILRGNLPQQIAFMDISPTVTYSNIQGGYSGVGNIDGDPMFLNASAGDWRLRSGSPCIDAGNNDAVPEGVEADPNGDPRFVDHACADDVGNPGALPGPIVDMGAYELQEAPTCGNGVCDAGEACETCACDCGECSCGDGVCAGYEDCRSCADDCPCDTMYVPEDYGSIQEAIDASRNGDEIIVAPGTYYEAINFLGKDISVRSSGGPDVTTIDATGLESSVVRCIRGEGSDAALEGFTLTGGDATIGGGMLIAHSSPTVTNCTFSGNSALHYGGGIFNRRSSPMVVDCTFERNGANGAGGGMYNSYSNPMVIGSTFMQNSVRLDGDGIYSYSFGGGGAMYNSSSHPTVISSTFTGNYSDEHGGAMYNWRLSEPSLTNCTFGSNLADHAGGGMYNYNGSNPTLTNCTFNGNSAGDSGGAIYNQHSSPTAANCIIWGNFPQEIGSDAQSSLTIAYSDVRGGHAGVGNIESDPMFLDADGGDWRLRSESPCVDAGDNDTVPGGVVTDLSGEARFADHACADDIGNGAIPIVDMGAYEFPDQPACGNGACDDGETCETCACDCGGCCGDGICAGYEDCLSCADDCPCETIYVPADYGRIQDAIDASHNGDEIIVAPGVYYEAISFQGKAITLRSADGPEVTTIDASGFASSVVRCVHGEGSDTTLEGFTLTGGNAVSGGGMYNAYSSPTVANCTLNGNSADDYGGGIYNIGGDPTLTNCNFSGNSAGEYGGGIYNDRSNATVTNCTFNANSSTGSYGNGGGMCNWQSDPAVTNCTFNWNSAGYSGGGMSNYYSDPAVTNCTFNGNLAGDSGAGIFNYYSDSAVTNCTFNGNSADDSGGGMFNSYSDPTVTNCTFSGNSANGDGGGIFNREGNPTVTNCTIAGNTADEAGGVLNVTNSTLTLLNSILWGNSDSVGNTEESQILNEEATVQVDYSAIQGWSGLFGGVGNHGLDPLFVDADGEDDIPGTLDDNLRLMPDSPAINAGDPDFVPQPGEADLDGHARVLCGRVDMGAYEFGIGDYDCDQSVDLTDFASWPACATGPSQTGFPNDCEAFNFDADDDIDLRDFAGFQVVLVE